MAFKCNLCPKIYPSLAAIKMHSRMAHGKINDPSSWMQVADPVSAPALARREAPPVQASAPAAFQGTLTEETGQKVCHGLECLTKQFEELNKLLARPRPGAPGQRPAQMQPPYGSPEQSEGYQPSGPKRSGRLVKGSAEDEGHEDKNTRSVLDNMMDCPHCKPIVKEHILGNWNNWFPDKLLPKAVEQQQQPAQQPAQPPAQGKEVKPGEREGTPAGTQPGGSAAPGAPAAASGAAQPSTPGGGAVPPADGAGTGDDDDYRGI